MPSEKASEAHAIARARRDVREHQRRVERVVEEREARRPRRHEAAGVEHEEQVLVALELVLAADELLPARGRLPVDGSVLVAAAGTRAAARTRSRRRACARRGAPPDRGPAARADRRRAPRLHVGVHLHGRRGGEAELADPEAERARGSGRGVAERVGAAAGRGHVVAQGGAAARGQVGAERQVGGGRGLEEVVRHRDGEAAARRGPDLDRDQVGPADGEDPGGVARTPRRAGGGRAARRGRRPGRRRDRPRAWAGAACDRRASGPPARAGRPRAGRARREGIIRPSSAPWPRAGCPPRSRRR